MIINDSFRVDQIYDCSLLMNEVSQYIFNETDIAVPFKRTQLSALIAHLEENESCVFGNIEVVFVDDEKIQYLNRIYLGHDYVTDVITFPYHEEASPAEGTLFCCIPQIKRQYADFETTFESEVLRIVIHGLLHLIGFEDQTDQQRAVMTALENKYLSIVQDS